MICHSTKGLQYQAINEVLAQVFPHNLAKWVNETSHVFFFSSCLKYNWNRDVQSHGPSDLEVRSTVVGREVGVINSTIKDLSHTPPLRSSLACKHGIMTNRRLS